MALVLLLLVLAICIFISFIELKRDIFSPFFLISFPFFGSTVFAIVNASTWGVEYSYISAIIITSSFVMIMLGSFLARKKTQSCYKIEYVECNMIRITNSIYFLSLAFLVFILFLTYREVQRIASLSLASYGNMLFNYKLNVVNADLEGARVKSYVAQGVKLSKGFAYVYLYIFVNNSFALKKNSNGNEIRNIKYLIPGIIYCLQCLIKGGRYETISFLVGLGFLYYYFWRRKVGWRHDIATKTIIKVTVIMIVTIIFFWKISTIIGRYSALNSSAFSYLSKYFAGGIVNFDSFVREGNNRNIVEKEVFAHFFRDLNSLGITDVKTITSHEFRRSPSGIAIGNAHTAIRNFYHDYGYLGVLFLSFIYSFLFNLFYYKVLSYKKLGNRQRFKVILYSSLIYVLVFYFFTDYFFSKIGIGFLVEILLMWLSYKFVFYKKGRKLKKGRKYENSRNSCPQ